MSSVVIHLHQDCSAMADAANISSHIHLTFMQNAVISFLYILIISSHQINIAIDNPSLLPSVYCLTTCSYPWNYVRAADTISHTEHMQSNCCGCLSHLSNFEMESKLPEISTVVRSTRANQYLTKVPSMFSNRIMNSLCS
jgi:hypothetical protein